MPSPNTAISEAKTNSPSRRAMTLSQIRPMSESAFHKTCRSRMRSSIMVRLLSTPEHPADDHADDDAADRDCEGMRADVLLPLLQESRGLAHELADLVVQFFAVRGAMGRSGGHRSRRYGLSHCRRWRGLRLPSSSRGRKLFPERLQFFEHCGLGSHRGLSCLLLRRFGRLTSIKSPAPPSPPKRMHSDRAPP